MPCDDPGIVGEDGGLADGRVEDDGESQLCSIDEDCDDFDPCTIDVCDEVSEECIHTWTEYPGLEGPIVDPTCTNDLDDDCDGLTDDEDPDCFGPCHEQIQALSDEIHAIDQGCTAIFRLGHPLMELLGFQLVCGPQNMLTEEEARSLSQLCSGQMLSDPDLHGQFVFCDKPVSEELCAFSVSTDTGMLTFEGWTAGWWSEILFPDTWRLPFELGENCVQQVDIQVVLGYDLTNCNHLASEEVHAAVDVAFRTAIPAAFVSTGSIINVVVLRFPIEFDMAIPRPADWIVLVNGTSCPGGSRDADGDNFVDYRCGGQDCDDSDPTINPGAMDVCGDGIDQDCDGEDAQCK